MTIVPVIQKLGLDTHAGRLTGPANEANAHPHCDTKSQVAICHNGVIENYYQIKEALQADGYEFKSETDTEVIVALLSKFIDQEKATKETLTNADLASVVKQATAQLHGTYGLVVLFKDFPNVIIAFSARKSIGHWCREKRKFHRE